MESNEVFLFPRLIFAVEVDREPLAFFFSLPFFYHLLHLPFLWYLDALPIALLSFVALSIPLSTSLLVEPST